MRTKLIDRAALPTRLATLREADSPPKIVFTNGCFDLLHVGHLRYLWQARKLGDLLIVGVNDDGSVKRLKGPDRPILACDERMRVLAGLACVDVVTSFDEDTPLALIQAIRPDILVKGGDYEIAEVAGHDVVSDWGGRTQILEFIEGCSSSDLIQRVLGMRAAR